MKKKLKDFYEMIDDVDIAMMTTRRSDGYLVSRPMAMQDRAKGADLWFVTSEETDKLDEIIDDPHVNLSWYKKSSSEWISVSGTAHLSRDIKIIRKLWNLSWKMWFPEGEGKDRGTPKDPRIIMIGVDIHSAVYMEVDKPKPVVLYEMVKGLITGKEPDAGKIRKIGPSDLKKTKRISAKKKTAKKSTRKKAATSKSTVKKAAKKKATKSTTRTAAKKKAASSSVKKASPKKPAPTKSAAKKTTKKKAAKKKSRK